MCGIVYVKNLVGKEPVNSLVRTLYENQKELRTLKNALDTSKDAVAIYDVDLNITYANRRFCELAECKRDEALHMQAADFLDEENLEIAMTYISKALQGESIPHLNMVAISKTGKKIDVEVAGSVIFDEQNEPIGILTIIKPVE